MKRVGMIIASVIFTPFMAQAGELPSGCYVSFANPSVCYSTASYPITWSTDSSSSGFQLLVQRYGVVTASILDSFNQCRDNVAAYSEAVAEQSSLIEQSIGALNSANKVNQSLRVRIKKLQKTCGLRCRSIK